MDGYCEQGCATQAEVSAHLDVPHYAKDCPHPRACPAHWDAPEWYDHNPLNYQCPGEGIKCLCWDIEQRGNYPAIDEE